MTETRFICPAHYTLTLVPERDTTGQFMSAAILDCALCGEIIDGMGGPSDGSVCKRCGDLMKTGATRSAIVWEVPNG